MAQFGEFFRWTTQAGTPITVNGTTITPLAQSLTLRWPRGGLVWNRPVALLINRKGQQEQLPIVDVTRIAQVVLFFIFMALGLVLFLRSTRRETP